MAGKGTLSIRILGDASGALKAIDDVGARVSTVGEKMRSFGSSMSRNVTAPIVAGFGLAVKAAADEEKEMATLANTLRNTVGATDSQVASTEKWITALQNATGVSDGQLRPALGKLLIAGRDIEQAQKDMAVALDIAAARGKPLETVIEAMGKAAQGNVGALGRLGVATKDASGEMMSYDEVLKRASETMGGAAAAAADTVAGRAAIMKAKFADLQENIGTALLPILDKLTTGLSTVASWFNELSPGMQNAIVAVAGIAAAVGPLTSALGNVTTAVKGVSTAMTFLAANPVVLAVAGIAALAAGAIYAYQHFESFRNFVDRLRGGLSQMVEWVRTNWPALLAVLTGPFGLAAVAIQRNWDSIIDGARNTLQGLRDWGYDVYLFFYGLPGTIVRAVGNLSNTLYGAGRDLMSGFVRGFADMLSTDQPGQFDDVLRALLNASPVGHIVNIVGRVLPYFDDGGVMPGPTGKHSLALVAGGETILPTHKRSVGGGAGKVEVHIHAPNAHVMDSSFADTVVKALVQYTRSNGAIPGLAA